MRTSVEFLQEKLPQKMIRRLRGRDFDVAQVDFENLFRAVSSFGDHQYPRLGPGVSNMILHAQQVSVQSASFFKISLQVGTAPRSIGETKLILFSMHI